MNPDFEKGQGLLPAIAQDQGSGKILMLGYMNREALDQTLSSGRVTFFSRTKNRLWQKGEESGNFLEVVSAQQDCDRDALLFFVRPNGPTCHTGSESCFDSAETVPQPFEILATLEKTIQERRKSSPAGSYTAKLFAEGIPRIAQKVGEEAVELAIASQHGDVDRCENEAADLLFHFLVLLNEKGIPLERVQDRLIERIRK